MGAKRIRLVTLVPILAFTGPALAAAQSLTATLTVGSNTGNNGIVDRGYLESQRGTLSPNTYTVSGQTYTVKRIEFASFTPPLLSLQVVVPLGTGALPDGWVLRKRAKTTCPFLGPFCYARRYERGDAGGAGEVQRAETTVGRTHPASLGCCGSPCHWTRGNRAGCRGDRHVARHRSGPACGSWRMFSTVLVRHDNVPAIRWSVHPGPSASAFKRISGTAHLLAAALAPLDDLLTELALLGGESDELFFSARELYRFRVP